MSESKTPVPPEPSDSERAEWREATENYVAWLETQLAAKDRELEELRQRDTCGREKLAGLRKELEKARREIERLTGVITGDAEIKQLVVDDKGLRLAASHPMMHALACEMASFFKSAGGINYVEVSMCHQEEGPFVLTLQRREGKTPNDLKAEAEKERDAARSAIRVAVELLERTRTCHFFVVPIRVTEVIAQLRSCLPAPDCAGAVGRGGEKERGTSEKGETI